MRLIAFFGLFIVAVAAKAQNIPDSISYLETLNGYRFIYLNQPTSTKEISAILENRCELAYDEFESGREACIFGYIFASVGTSLILYPFASVIANHEANWAFIYAGVGFVGLSVPIFNSYHKKTEDAINIYNQSVGSLGIKTPEPTLKLGLSTSGIGLAYNF
jgi:hypothetical protein